MSSKAEETVRIKMESLRLSYDTEVLFLQQKMDAFTVSFRKLLEFARDRAPETTECQDTVIHTGGSR
ncbi:hypothetical protein L6164_011039 [Bauhinia variegata]|uniref:Uncharacterized protein n=1 Tax=Bauhinia variegata TaxID=167791 RepID=A0ACB9P4K2_BAUVA|nr:hypothetical protein L6164_011039 [Bauhinia variegata]